MHTINFRCNILCKYLKTKKKRDEKMTFRILNLHGKSELKLDLEKRPVDLSEYSDFYCFHFNV